MVVNKKGNCFFGVLRAYYSVYMSKLKIVTLSLVGGFILSSCVTLLGKKQTISVNSYPQGAEVYADGDYIGITPLNFRSKSPYKYLNFYKEGYLSKSISTSTKHNGHVWWNLLFTGFIGVLVDIPYFEKYAETSYYVSLELQPKPAPKPAVVIPKVLSERRASYTTLSKIVFGNSNTEMTAKEIYRKYKSAVFMIYTSDDVGISQGSGFFVSSEGIGVSNYHVFEGSYKGKEIIKLSDGKTYKVQEVLAYSKKYDYIIFKVQGNNFNYIPIAKRGYEVGEEVYAIGSPKGLENTLSNGLISQKHSDYIIQISVPIDHGSSGGALINSYGEVIGITSGGDDDSGANLNFARDIMAIFNTVY